MFSLRLFAFLALLTVLPAWARPPGILAPEPLNTLLKTHLPLLEPQNLPEREALQNRVNREGGELLATEGYFNARFFLEGESLDALNLRVEPGPRAIIKAVHLNIEGPVPPARQTALREGWLLKAGAAFRQEDWDDAKEQALQNLLEQDFPAARMSHSLATVDAEQNQVVLEITLESGLPCYFGKIEVEGLSRYAEDLPKRYNTTISFDAPYREENLIFLQSALENTPYFSSVSVRLDMEAGVQKEEGGLIVPVKIRLRERTPHHASLGAGLSSNTGARAELNFFTADFLRRAWQLSSGIRLEQLKQAFYADVFLPPNSSQYRYSAGVLVEHSDIQDLKLQTQSLGLNRKQVLGESIDLTLALNYLAEKQTPKNEESTRNRALAFNSIWNWHPQDKGVSGDQQALQVQVGASLKPVSDQNFVRLYGRYQKSFAISRLNTLGLRMEGGIVLANARQGIPQNYLFRAGGSNSVRGYGYQSLGVQENEATLGGRYLLTLSGEMTHWFSESNWGAALFVDAGNANDDKEAFRLKTGYGIGARWKNPAGSLGMDLARGDRWRLHFALNIPF